MSKIRILTFNKYYLPGYKAGGPIRTIENMVDRLKNEFYFKIITTDRDFDDTEPYPDVVVDGWNRVSNAEVYYCSPENRSISSLLRVIKTTPHDILYLNSFFDITFTIKTLLLRRLGFIPEKSVVVAPRGEFSPGALILKQRKKTIYLAIVKLIGLYKDVTWQASSEFEEADIRRHFGRRAKVVIAPDMPPKVSERFSNQVERPKKVQGRLKILFLSRISPKKNLDGALRMLGGVLGDVQFHIYGPEEDAVHWEKCRSIIESLPPNIQVEYRGVVPYEQVVSVMAEYDLFLLPTLGENFGHVILEALRAGCPVVLSDQTPWRDLESKGIGWDIPLAETNRFVDVLNYCVSMDNAEHTHWSDRAHEYAREIMNADKTFEQNKKLFCASHNVPN